MTHTPLTITPDRSEEMLILHLMGYPDHQDFLGWFVVTAFIAINPVCSWELTLRKNTFHTESLRNYLFCPSQYFK